MEKNIDQKFNIGFVEPDNVHFYKKCMRLVIEWLNYVRSCLTSLARRGMVLLGIAEDSVEQSFVNTQLI